jgi:hypothetical protein
MVPSVQRMIQQLEYMPDKILPRSMPKIPASHVSPEKKKGGKDLHSQKANKESYSSGLPNDQTDNSL